MAPGKKRLNTATGYPLPSSCSVSSLNEFVTDGNASFLRAARSGNVEKIAEHLKGNIDINTSNANGLNALHLAAKEGHVNVVTELLKRGANVNAATKKGNTALHIASLAGQEEVVRVLIQVGANVNVQSQNGFTPLYMAAQENHDSVVSFLLASGANQSLATEDGFTPLAVALQQGHDKVVAVLLENDTKGRVRLPALHIAAKKDDCKAATLLLQSDHNPDVTSKSGFTPLHIAAHYGNENIAKILLTKGADVNYAAKHQITPLHVASKWGKINMVTLLLDNGALIESSTRDGLTPLHCAARSGHDQVVDLLLEKGAPFLAKTKNGLAPLHMASQGDHVDSARILLYHKAPVDDVTVDYLTALHVAAHCGHVKVAKLLLDRKADPNARALNGFTPLHIACKKNRIKVVELLLKHGASIEATTESGLTPLHVASFMGCMNIVIHLIQNGANPDVPTVRGETPLHLAARANQTDIIRILLRNGASVDARAREEQTPLHIAARLGNVDIVSLLLQHGAAVDATTKDMYTALHIAAKEDQEEVASHLLDHGATLTATTKKGFTPLHLAAKYGNIKVARLLIQKSAPVDAQGKNGVTPLHVAAHYDHVNVALLLLDKGASPHAMAKNGYTPLHIAAKKNQMDIASTLLEYGAKTNSESKAGFTPLHLSSQEGHAEMSSLLIDNKADVNHKANNGLTPLHLCAQDDRVNVANILVRNGAEVGPQTKAGYTPLHVASHFGQINMVKFLLQNEANVHTTTTHGYTSLHQAAQQGHTLVVNYLLENQASPNVTTMQGQTPLSIAQRLGYISVVETLKVVTETTVTTTTTTITEEKYKVVAPETMQETFMTDSEDEGGADFDEAAIFGKPTHATHVYLPYVEGQNFQMSEEAMLGDQSYGYLTADEMKSLGDDSLPIDVTKDEKHHDLMHSVKQFGAPMVEEDKLSPQHGTPVESGFSEKFSPDNIDLGHVPVHAGGRLKWKTFLVSFMVDARGGAMRGCRHSGVRVIIPPRKASMPMRITCRYLRKEKLIHPPPLMEGEACASRILEMGPVGARFLGPVIIEVPHFASTRGKEREITILRSDTGETWREHTLEASEEAVQDVLNESFEGEELSALEDLNTNRITRILTTDFPQYFAVVTRVRQEVHGVGPEGGMVSSTVVPQVQAIFPEGALTKKIRVGLQAQPIAPELVAKLLGNRVAVSPIVTVEPRRRKFHKPITLTIPVPQAATKGMINQYSGDAPTLRLLCSITGSTKSGGSSKAQWEDVTGSTPLTFVNDCVSFTTTVSARFWLMDCRQVNEVTRFATELYQEAVYVPFMSKFVIFAKRYDPYEAQLRVFCMTDDKEDKTLEHQENFTEVAKSRDVEVLEGKMQYLEFAGNLAPVTKSGEQLKLAFQAFHENRLPFTIRVKDPHIEPMGRIAFMKESKTGRGEPPQIPICNLNVALPEVSVTESSGGVLELVTLEKRYDFIQEAGLSKPELIHRADLRLSDIAQGLDKDWILLAQQLDVSESDIKQIKSDASCEQSEQALMMLRLWLQKSGAKATGNELEKGLRKINREDIIKNCMFNVELVTDDVEKAVAKVHLDQSGFDVFKEELGSSREASMRRGASLDISYDEQDIMKEAESAAETSSETGSLFERDQLSQALTDDKDKSDQLKKTCRTLVDVEALFPKCKIISSVQKDTNHSSDIADTVPISNEQMQSPSLDISVNCKTMGSEPERQSTVIHEVSSVKLHDFWPAQQCNISTKSIEFIQNSEIECPSETSQPSDNSIEPCSVNQNMSISHKGVVLTESSDAKNDACAHVDVPDFGYFSMDKDGNISPGSVTNVKCDSLNSEISSSEPKILHQNISASAPLQNEESEFKSQLPNENMPPDACKNLVTDNQQNFVLTTLQQESCDHERIAFNSSIADDSSDVRQLSPAENGNVLNNVCSSVAMFAKDEHSMSTSVSNVDSYSFKSEDSNSQDARIRRASKTPPPTPVDEFEKDGVDVKVKETLFSPSSLHEKLREDGLKESTKVDFKSQELAGQQEIPARLTESETWPSLELDTSQVSISSLPDDEKSEPTTATASDAVVIATDLDKTITRVENIEKSEVDEHGVSTHIIQTTVQTTSYSVPEAVHLEEGGLPTAASLGLEQEADSPGSPELSFAEKRDFFQKLSLSSSSNATPTHTLKGTSEAESKTETYVPEEIYPSESPDDQLSFKECLKFFEKPDTQEETPKPEIKDIKKEVWTVIGDENDARERLDSVSDVSDIEREREIETMEVWEKRRSTVSIDEQVSLPLYESKEVLEAVFDSTKDAKVEVMVKTFVPGSEMLEICSVENISYPEGDASKSCRVEEVTSQSVSSAKTDVVLQEREGGSDLKFEVLQESTSVIEERQVAKVNIPVDGKEKEILSNEEFISKTFKTLTESQPEISQMEISKSTVGAFKKEGNEKGDTKWQRESPDNINLVKETMAPTLDKSEIFICTEETLDNVKKILSVADAESNVVIHENEATTSALPEHGSRIKTDHEATTSKLKTSESMQSVDGEELSQLQDEPDIKLVDKAASDKMTLTSDSQFTGNVQTVSSGALKSTNQGNELFICTEKISSDVKKNILEVDKESENLLSRDNAPASQADLSVDGCRKSADLENQVIGCEHTEVSTSEVKTIETTTETIPCKEIGKVTTTEKDSITIEDEKSEPSELLVSGDKQTKSKEDALKSSPTSKGITKSVDIEALKLDIQRSRESGMQFEETFAQSAGSNESKSESCFSSLKDQSVEIEFLPVLEVSGDVSKVSVDMTGHEALGTPCSFHKETDFEMKHAELEGSFEEVERNKLINEFEKQTIASSAPETVEKAEYEGVEKGEQSSLEEMIYKRSVCREASGKETVQSVQVTQFTEHSTERYNVPSEKLIEKFSSKKIHIESSDSKEKFATHKLDQFLDSVTQQGSTIALPSDMAPVLQRTEEWIDQSGELLRGGIIDSTDNGIFEDRPPTLDDEPLKRSSPTAESFDDKARVEQCDTDVMMQLLDFVSRNEIELSEVRTEDEAPDIEEDVSPSAEEEVCGKILYEEAKSEEKVPDSVLKEKTQECLKVIEADNLLLSPQRSSFDSVTSPSRKEAPSDNVDTVIDTKPQGADIQSSQMVGRMHPQSSLEVEVGSHDDEDMGLHSPDKVVQLSFVEEESIVKADISDAKRTSKVPEIQTLQDLENRMLQERKAENEKQSLSKGIAISSTSRKTDHPIEADSKEVIDTTKISELKEVSSSTNNQITSKAPVTQDMELRIGVETSTVQSVSKPEFEEQLPKLHEKSVLIEDKLIQSTEEADFDHATVLDPSLDDFDDQTDSKFVPCAFVNTAFAGAELIDEVEQSTPIRARSPYEVIRDDIPDKSDSSDLVEHLSTDLSNVRTTYVTKLVEVRRRPLLQQIPSEISEEDLVERELVSPVFKQDLEAFDYKLEADESGIGSQIERDNLGIITTEHVTTEKVKTDSGYTVTKTVTSVSKVVEHFSEGTDESPKLCSDAVKDSENCVSDKTSAEKVSSLQDIQNVSSSDFSCTADAKEKEKISDTISVDDKYQGSQIITHSSTIVKTISSDAGASSSYSFEQMGQEITESQITPHELESASGASSKAKPSMNGPGEVEYHSEYDETDEFSGAKWSAKYEMEDAAYERSSQDIMDDAKKSRYSSVSDDVIDSEIGEILSSDQQFDDIIERPMTPEPPVEEFSSTPFDYKDIKTRKELGELDLHKHDPYFSDEEQVVSSPVHSPEDSKAGFAYGMQFEKDLLDVAEEAMDVDSDPYSEEKEPVFGYGMRFERDPELEEDIPCYGDLYTHEEEDEDALENGEKSKFVARPKKDPEFDILAGRKFFTKNVEIDELSMSSLQEFERLEAEIVSGRKSSVGSVDSLNGKLPASKSGDHDDVSMSSLTEFERIEKECLEVDKIDPAMQESVTQLSEIEEGHESQASETSMENKSEGGKDDDLSLMEDYDHHLDDIDNIILKAEPGDKSELPFQLLMKKSQKAPEDSTVEFVKEQISSGKFIKEISSQKIEQTIKTSSDEGCMRTSLQSVESFSKLEERSDDIDQDSLHDEFSLKPDSLLEEKQEYLDSLHEGKCDDSLQEDIPDEMRDSLFEDRHLEDDSLHEMDILPDESSLSMESSFAAAISHDSSKTEDQEQKKRHDSGQVGNIIKFTELGSNVITVSKDNKTEIIVTDLPRDIMLSSTDSLEQSSSAAAAFHLESESVMSTSLTGAPISEDSTMISSTDTLEHEGRITFRYEDIPVDDLEILVKDGRKVIVDSEGNIQTEYDVKHFLDTEENINYDLNYCSKEMLETTLPSTTMHVQSAMTTVSFINEPEELRSKAFKSTSDTREERSKYESSHSAPDVEVEEIHTTDEFGNPKTIKKIRKVITTKTQFSSSSSSDNVEEKMKEFLREHGAGEAAGTGEEVVKEERSVDEKGNVVLVRTVKQQILSQPEIHSRTFSGPDAALMSQEFVEQFKSMDSTDDVCEFENIDDQGNLVRVTQQVVIKPEVHSVSFSGPNAHQQMEEYMKRFSTVSRNGDGKSSWESSSSSVQISTSTKQHQEYIPSESSSQDVISGTQFVEKKVSSLIPEASEQIVHSTKTASSSVVGAGKPSESKDQTSSVE